MTPRQTRSGWVITEQGGGSDALAAIGLFILALAGIAGLVFFVLDPISGGGSRFVGVVGVGLPTGLALLCFYGAVRLKEQDGAWHPGTITFSHWPIPIGEPVTVRYEQRRRDVVAEPPLLEAHLELRWFSSERRTAELPISIPEPSNREPLRAEFELVVPEEWRAEVRAGAEVRFEINRVTGVGSLGFNVHCEVLI